MFSSSRLRESRKEIIKKLKGRYFSHHTLIIFMSNPACAGNNRVPNSNNFKAILIKSYYNINYSILMKRKTKQQTNGGNKITHYFGTYKADIKDKKNHTKKGSSQNTNIYADYHQSSRQIEQISSHTEVMVSEPEEVQIVEEYCLQMVMIGPCDTTYFKSIQKKLQGVLENYNKKQIIKIIQENAKFSGGSNVENLERLEDEEFWTKTLPKIIQYAVNSKKQKSISSCIPMLLKKSGQMIQLSKAQILMVLINMFLCSLPPQTHRRNLNFAQLMCKTSDDSESATSIKFQKLKCIVNYFKIMCKRKYKDLEEIKIEIQRSLGNFDEKEITNIEYKMKDVQIVKGLVQDRDGFDIIVDFANKKIGGGVLTKGAVQEQILFCVYPELFVTLCITYELLDNEALVIYNVEKLNGYEGYSSTFKFIGTCQNNEEKRGPFNSIILAVDAIDFNSVSYREKAQYKAHYVYRQLHKFFIGVQAAGFNSDDQMGVCTGKWGCGAFAGDVYLKFLIQWVACSIDNRNMTFMCQQDQIIAQLKVMYNFLRKFDSQEILQVIEDYSQYSNLSDYHLQVNFLEFVKKYTC